jgi:capsular polysaccharide biosynthesis protein
MTSMLGETILHQRPIEGFARAGLLGPGKPMQHMHSLAPARIPLPPLATGRHFLERWPVRELPEPGAWARGYYDSYAPPLFVLHNVMVHSSAGIIAVGDQVIAETLSFTEPKTHAYRNLVRAIAIRRGKMRRLAGTHIAALTAGETNYYHSMMLSLARLQAVPGNYLAAAAGLLVPRGAVGQPEVLALLDLLPSLAVEEVGREETLLVETLVFPLSVCGEASYHPCVADFFRRVSANVAPSDRRLPRRLYIDRRGSPIRRLTNEEELMRALAPLGFVAVRPDMLSVADQVRLFRNAEAIVAPHGAALTNIGYTRPGCVLIELLMDAYVNWCFRHLAALMQVRYDCVLGRAQQPWGELDLQFHLTPWTISVNHVVAAVAQGLGETARAA